MGGLFGGGKSTTIVNNTPAVPINRQIIPERFDMRAGGSRMVGSIQDKGLAEFNTTFSGDATTNRADSVNRFKDLYGQSQGNVDLLSSGLLDQRIDPMRESLAMSRGQLERNLERRGLAGSSIANNAITEFDRQGAREISNQQSLGMQELVNAQTNQLGLQRNLASDINTVAQQTLAQELAGLGLDVSAAGVLINANQPIFPPSAGSTTTTRDRPSLLDTAGKMAMAYGSMTGCWVARAVYGESNPQWLIFREWLYTLAPKWLFTLYIRFGERFASFIKDKPKIKNIIRHYMDKACLIIIKNSAIGDK